MTTDHELVQQFIEQGAWVPWSGPEFDEDVHPSPPDETDVLFFIQTSLGNRIEISRTSRRCGTYGPSLATHWKPLPEQPPCEKCPECDGSGVVQRRVAYSEVVDERCEDCKGKGRKPAITAAEAALAAAKRLQEREKRVREWAEAQAPCQDWGGENGREILAILNAETERQKEIR